MKRLTILPFPEAAGYRPRVMHPVHKRLYNTHFTYLHPGLLLLFLAVAFFPCLLDCSGKPACPMPAGGLGKPGGALTIPQIAVNHGAGNCTDNYTIGDSGCVLLPDYETALFESVNRTRQEHNLPPYEQDRRLITFAREKGEDMLAHGYIDHDSPRLGRPGQEASRRGIIYATYGENLAGTLKARDMQPELAFSLLMESEYHRGAILSKDKSHLGIGVVRGPDRGIVYVMHFLSL